MEDLNSLRGSFLSEIGAASDLQGLQLIRVKYCGRKGLVTAQLRALSAVPPAERPAFGKTVNELKQFIEQTLEDKEASFMASGRAQRLIHERIDITVPGMSCRAGSYHPLNIVLDEIKDIFISMGFGIEEGPEIELDYYNFEALNIPKHHPARDMQDTFYVSDDVVLRTHTSPVQVRVMEKRRPPLRIIAPGKVYRCDADVSHTPMFHQVEGLMVDDAISFCDLKGVLELFIHGFFGSDTPVRFRPSFFPFTEPSAEVDIGCIFCKGKGCRICKTTGWLEVMGCGMVNPKVFEMSGYPADAFTGFAFGMGVERLTMLKYSIDDIRLFYENDLRFLRQF